jgi:predicted ATPase
LARLLHIHLEGFRSIRSLDLALRPLTVLIGPNGAGKSNLVLYFRMLNHITPERGDLQGFVMRGGGAATLLHDGPKQTPALSWHLQFDGVQPGSRNEYEATLAWGAGDRLWFGREAFRYVRDPAQETKWFDMGGPGSLAIPPGDARDRGAVHRRLRV